jgi:hypothetical protein
MAFPINELPKKDSAKIDLIKQVASYRLKDHSSDYENLEDCIRYILEICNN